MKAKNYSSKTRSQGKRTIKVSAPSPKVGIVCVGGFGAQALAQLTAILSPSVLAAKLGDRILAAVTSRFAKVGADGALLPESATEWVAVYDHEQDLTFTRGMLDGERNWKDSLAAASAVRLFGKDDWRAPTLRERFLIADHTRHSPAIDTNYFAKDSGWEWTSTVDASGPSGYAWFVYLSGGYAYRSFQGGHFQVRAVRAGQP